MMTSVNRQPPTPTVFPPLSVPHHMHGEVTRNELTDAVSFADVIADDESSAANWFVKPVKQKTVQHIRKIVGGNASSVKVKAVASDWHVFAGKLDPATTEDR